MVIFQMKKLIFLFVVVSFVTACSTENKRDNTRLELYANYITEHQLKPVKRVRVFKLQDWKSLDNRHLILSSFQKKQYLVSLAQYCNNIESANAIIVKQTLSNSLNAKFDAIIVDREPSIPCYIKSIYDINSEQQNEILALRKNNI